MARIKIEDLPVLEDLSEKEIKGIFGGTLGGYKPQFYMRTTDPEPNAAKQEEEDVSNLIVSDPGTGILVSG